MSIGLGKTELLVTLVQELGGSVSTRFTFDESALMFKSGRMSRSGGPDLNFIRAFCTKVGQQVAYTLACYLVKMPPKPELNYWEGLPMELPKLPVEQQMRDLLIKGGIMDWVPGTSMGTMMEKLIAELAPYMRPAEEPAPKPAPKDGPVEIPLRSFDFS